MVIYGAKDSKGQSLLPGLKESLVTKMLIIHHQVLEVASSAGHIYHSTNHVESYTTHVQQVQFNMIEVLLKYIFK